MKSLWSGRFKSEMHPLLKCFSYSLAVDHELFHAEIEVNEAYARMLAKIKLIRVSESRAILRALKSIRKEWKNENVCLLSQQYEDVHTYIQQELERKIGKAGKKIHTGRSRNDLVITSTRVYLRGRVSDIEKQIQKTQKALVQLAKEAGDGIIPGLTHLKKAQPILMAHHLLAYVEMLEEDRSRFVDVQKRINVLPLGSAALAGSSLPLDRNFLAKALGFDSISANSLQATSDRGFMAEILSSLAILWMHLSRLSEDFILWNSEAFGLIELEDSIATGSSLMPQKKNPDLFELIRGRAGVIFGQLQAILTLQKGLPLAYHRDLQEDKPGLFDAFRKTQLALELLSVSLDHVHFNPKAMAAALQDDAIYATDVLEYLVRKEIPFSEAHEAVGKAVRYAQDHERSLRDLSLKEWKIFSKAFDEKVYELFDPAASISAKKTSGSTHPARVRKEIVTWTKKLNKQ